MDKVEKQIIIVKHHHSEPGFCRDTFVIVDTDN